MKQIMANSHEEEEEQQQQAGLSHGDHDHEDDDDIDLVVVAVAVADHQVLVERVCELYAEISKLESLKPCKQVNTLFTQLVNTCIPSYPTLDVSKLPDPVQRMRSHLIRLCGQAESLLESHYSDILGSTFHNPLHHLSLFPYFDNYLKLAKLEFTILLSTTTTTTTTTTPMIPSRVAFIGSGPLPLTSLVLATHHLPATSFHNYDIDPSANSMASKLVQSDPDMASRMTFHTANILDVCGEELEQFQVVFLAALVGMDMDEKRRVIDHLARHMAPGATLMLRSAHGARAFLYPVVQPSDLPGFEVLSVFHPTDEVINSVVIARKLNIPHPLAPPPPHPQGQGQGVDDHVVLAPNQLIVSSKCCCEQMRGYNRNNLDQVEAVVLAAMEEHIAG